MQIELSHDIATVCLRRLHAEIEQRSHFLCALSLRQQLRDLTLPMGEDGPILGGDAVSGKESSQNHFRNARSKKGSTAFQRFNCGYQIASRIRLEDESAGAGIQYRARDLVRFGDRQNEHLGARIVVNDLTRGFKTIEAWHADV